MNLASNQYKDQYKESDIAIIGLAGRFPGAATIEEFWQNLCRGVESITRFSDEELEQDAPALRQNPDYVKAGAILSDIEQFDAGFFGYSAKEAALTDPQQRILLECAWEAFERAGYNPESYPGRVGVYAGSSMSTYLLNNVGPSLGITSQQPFIETDMAQFQAKIGNDRNYLATRISHKLNLKGPSLCVQTACSTALVAVHLACQSLLAGECDMALAGGVSIIVPHKGGYLYEESMVRSPDGHCRAFDAAAQGTLFGNGAGLVLLKRLPAAIADQDQIIAVIKGSAINNDGNMKVGYTAPSIEGQAGAIREALALAEVDASTVGYVEAHGTATQLGDPIEVAALTQAFLQSTTAETLDAQWCAIGSVKSNIGHLDEAAGIVGLIKAALSIQHGQIPPSLHFTKPNPQIDFANSPFYVNTALRDWPQTGTPRRAGVSSFGVGGTNCHVVLEEAPTVDEGASFDVIPAEWRQDDGEAIPRHNLLALSAQTPTALAELTQRYIAYCTAHPETDLADLCFTANTGRKHFAHRLAVVADSVKKLSHELHKACPAPTIAVTDQALPTIAFLFTGQGSQAINMGRDLYESEPLFRQTLEQCDEILRPLLGESILAVLYPDLETNEQSRDAHAKIDETRYTQPALFALEYALAQLWLAWGINPSVVMGHSVGEYVAACIAGIFSLEEGLRLIANRAQLMQALPPGGEMVAVSATAAQVATYLEPDQSQVAIAAYNGPQSVVLSGSATALAAVVAQLTADGIKTKTLTVSHAFHSPLMEPMLAAFAQVAQSIPYAPPTIPVISNLTGRVATGEMSTPDYWVQQIRQPVQFAIGMQTLHELGATLFIEIGPKPVLLGIGQECLPDQAALWLPSLHSHEKDHKQILTSLGRLYQQGIPVAWAHLYPTDTHQRLALPTYPFQRQPCWIDAPKPGQQTTAHFPLPTVPESTQHPLLGQRLQLPGTQEIRFQSRLSKNSPRWMKDHRGFGMILLPGVAYFEMALAAGRAIVPTCHPQLADVVIHQAMIFDEHGEDKTVQLLLQPHENSTYLFQIFSFVKQSGDSQSDSSAHQETWLLHASGKLIIHTTAAVASVNLAELQSHYTQELSVEALYKGKEAIDLGPSFWATQQLWRNETSGLGQFTLPEPLHPDAAHYYLHPALIDAGLLALLIIPPEEKLAYFPISVKQLRFYEVGKSTTLWCQASLHPDYNPATPTVKGNVHFFTPDGRLVAAMEELLFMKANQQALLRTAKTAWQAWLYQVQWQAAPLSLPRPLTSLRDGNGTNPCWLIVGHDLPPDLILAVEKRCAINHIRCHFASPHLVGRQRLSPSYQFNPAQPHDFEELIQRCGVINQVIFIANPVAAAEQGARSANELATSLLHLTQALIQTENAPGLWLVTQGGQPVNDLPVQQIAQSVLWGLGKVIAAEYPELACRRVDLDPAASAEIQASLLFAELSRPWLEPSQQEEEVAYRGQTRYVPRLARYQRGTNPQKSLILSDQYTYLITGGMGAIGLQVAHALVAQGARHLVLVGRTAPQPAVTVQIEQLRATGANVLIVQADVADFEQMAQLFAAIDGTAYPLRGLIHAAGVLDDGLLQQQTAARFARVLAPKVQGAWNLHQLTLAHDLDFFVLFSSITSLLGTAGQANYAAANAFLDGLASYRQSQGLPGLSINWGSWAEIGMTARLGLVERLQQKGEGAIAPPIGVEILGQLIGESAAQIGVLPIEWRRFLKQPASQRLFYKNFAQLGEPMHPRPAIAPEQADHFRQQLIALTPKERIAHVTQHVRTQVAETLGVDTTHLSTEANIGFVTLGMNSLTSIELRNRLQRSLHCSLPVTFAFDYPTVEKVVAYLIQKLFAPVAAEAESPSATGQRLVNETRLDPKIAFDHRQSANQLASAQDGEEESLALIFQNLTRELME